VYITYCTDSNFELIKTYAMMVEDNEIKYTELTLFLDEVMTARICPNEGERLAKTSILARRGHAKQYRLITHPRSVMTAVAADLV
jgi:hypothetical protein